MAAKKSNLIQLHKKISRLYNIKKLSCFEDIHFGYCLTCKCDNRWNMKKSNLAERLPDQRHHTLYVLAGRTILTKDPQRRSMNPTSVRKYRFVLSVYLTATVIITIHLFIKGTKWHDKHKKWTGPTRLHEHLKWL